MTYRGTIWSSILRRQFLLDHDIWPYCKRLIGQTLWGSNGFCIDECRLANAVVLEFDQEPCYFYRTSRTHQTAINDYATNMRRINGTINPVLILKRLYLEEVSQQGRARTVTADVLMSWIHASMMYLAPMEPHSYRDGLKKLKESGVFPMRIVPEYSYSCRDCIKEHRKKGDSLLRSIGYYYSSTRWGLFLYRISLWKVFLRRALLHMKRKS